MTNVIIKFKGVKHYSYTLYKKDRVPIELVDGRKVIKETPDVSKVDKIITKTDIHYIPIDKITHMYIDRDKYYINDIETTKEEYENILRMMVESGYCIIANNKGE